MPEASHQATRTRMLGRYAIYEPFAAGGMATLHYGRLFGPAGFSRTVAIKQLHAHLAEDPDFVAMFLDEARLAARIQHPHVIQTLDVVSSEGEIFVILDYVHGDSLSRLLRETRHLGELPSPSLACTVLFHTLEGLHAAHEARNAKGESMELVHRDVSPHNVLVGTDGAARVLDFGVAKARGRAQTTRSGQLKGKLAYMAPEQFRGNVTRRSDIFSAAIVLWEALTCRPLFRGEEEAETIDKLLHRPIPSPREFAPAVPPALEAVVMRGLERDASKRYATAREMAIELDQQLVLATPVELGGWVQRVAGATLAHRAKRLATIEEEFVRVGALGVTPFTEHEGTAIDVAPSVHRLPAASITGATVPTVAVPGLARTDRKVTADFAGDKASPGGEWAGSALLSSVGPLQRWRPTRILRAAGVMAAGALGVLVLARSRGQEPPNAAGAASTTVATVPPEHAAAVPEALAGTVTLEPPSEQDASEALTTSPVKKVPAFVPVRKRPSCSPAYTADERGVRHYKPECL